MTKIDSRLIPEYNIGLIGHVDHGKTTLTEALSGKWTDTHSEEIKRGISIRLGYADVTIYKDPKAKGSRAYGTTKKNIYTFNDSEPQRTISLVDVPGHETLMATVLSGASIMDAAILVISGNEECPQPQTNEHLTVMDIAGIRNIIVVQTKIDLVSKEQALANYKQIKSFLKGSVAENAPIIPISARQNINLGVLLETIENQLKTPERDPKKEPKFLVARSFDVNKPGTSIDKLKGGVIGGSLIQGVFKIGDEIEIKPGIKRKDKYEPMKTKIIGLHKANKHIDELGPGGLAGLSTELDPYLAKSDSLSGSVVGLVGKLPPIHDKVILKTKLLDKVVGSKETIQTGKLNTGEVLMLTVGTTRTAGSITSARPDMLEIALKLPVCAEKGSKVAISKMFSSRWRLIGFGEIS